MSLLNSIVESLEPYPMEELSKLRAKLRAEGKAVYDFGTGDPDIPTWEPIRQALASSIPTVSRYPSVRGTDALKSAHEGYLQRRFSLSPSPEWSVIPSAGSKEAVFHVALCLVGRQSRHGHSRRTIIYPDPGYPVYRSSILFAGGNPHPVRLSPDNGWLLEPWTLPPSVISDTAALWLNYPHNPTGATAPRDYWKRVLEWAHTHDVILLSDDCYTDIYVDTGAPNVLPPACPLEFSTDRVLSFMSLSKRSGLTGYRSGLIAGDARLIAGLLAARANFGVASPEFVSPAAVVAWNDDSHVKERRRVFTRRVTSASGAFSSLGLLDRAPEATFYLWCLVPQGFHDDDLAFARALAEAGVITSPSQWLSEGLRGFVRFALCPDDALFQASLPVIARVCGLNHP
jgi:LL-diaminopimelate aminotransferase